MKLGGHRSLPYPPETVWRGLMAPELLCRAIPGCRSLEPTGDGTFAGTLSLQVGAVRGELEGTLEIHDLAPFASYRLRGSYLGSEGALSGEATVRLEEEGLGTRLGFEVEAQAQGRLAAPGGKVLESALRVLARKGLEGVERELGARADAARRERGAKGETREIPGVPSFGGLHRSFLSALLEETLPRQWRPWVALAALVVLALFAWLLLTLRGG